MTCENISDMKDVLITISSSQALGGDRDDMEFVTRGKYSVDDDGIRLMYEESELTGMSGTMTDFLVTPGTVIMSRSGSVNSQMIFREGAKESFAYRTPFGTLNMGLDTYRIHHALGKDGGSMEIEYDIDMNRSVISRNRFKIHVKDLKGN